MKVLLAFLIITCVWASDKETEAVDESPAGFLEKIGILAKSNDGLRALLVKLMEWMVFLIVEVLFQQDKIWYIRR